MLSSGAFGRVLSKIYVYGIRKMTKVVILCYTVYC